jgi:vacuolar-type H+-ATPase subunit I/STV1
VASTPSNERISGTTVFDSEPIDRAESAAAPPLAALLHGGRSTVTLFWDMPNQQRSFMELDRIDYGKEGKRRAQRNSQHKTDDWLWRQPAGTGEYTEGLADVIEALKTRNAELEMRNAELEMRNAEVEMRNAKVEMRNTKVKQQLAAERERRAQANRELNTLREQAQKLRQQTRLQKLSDAAEIAAVRNRYVGRRPSWSGGAANCSNAPTWSQHR